MNKEKYVCFIARGTPNHGLESLIKREYLYYKQFAETFDQLIFLDVSKVFTSPVLSKGDVDEAAHGLLPAKFTVIIPNSLADFKDFLKSHAMVVVSNFSEEWYDWYIHYYLKRYQIPIIYIHTMSEISNFQIQNLSKFKFLGEILKIFKKAYFRLEEHLFCARVDTLFISNPQNAGFYKRSSRFNEIVLTNSRFYDVYLNDQRQVSEDFVVFLDSMVPYHGDQIRYGFKPIDKERYYPALRAVLQKVSQKLRKEIVICLHPKYDEANIKSDFGDFWTFKFRTDEFVSRAAVVLFHETSSINSVVLYNKKVIQLTGKYFNDFVRSNAESFRNEFPCPVVDIFDHNDEDIGKTIDELKIDAQAHERFLLKYIITSGEKGVRSSEQIVRKLKEKYQL